MLDAHAAVAAGARDRRRGARHDRPAFTLKATTLVHGHQPERVTTEPQTVVAVEEERAPTPVVPGGRRQAPAVQHHAQGRPTVGQPQRRAQASGAHDVRDHDLTHESRHAARPDEAHGVVVASTMPVAHADVQVVHAEAQGPVATGPERRDAHRARAAERTRDLGLAEPRPERPHPGAHADADAQRRLRGQAPGPGRDDAGHPHAQPPAAQPCGPRLGRRPARHRRDQAHRYDNAPRQRAARRRRHHRASRLSPLPRYPPGRSRRKSSAARSRSAGALTLKNGVASATSSRAGARAATTSVTRAAGSKPSSAASAAGS